MSEFRYWIAPVENVGGQVGTGVVDVAIATQVLYGPKGFDMPGTGEMFLRAGQYFIDAAKTATSARDRADSYRRAAQTLNNLAIWHVTRNTDPQRIRGAYDCFRTAELQALQAPGEDELLGRILLNLATLLSATGNHGQARPYIDRARALGVH